METFRNIVLLGTSHVAEESVKNIKSAFEQLFPEIVAVELDRNRLYSLKTEQRRPKNSELIRAFGIPGFLFYVIGELVQRKVGKIVNIEPGSDMLTAIEEAEKYNARIALIDRDISVTMRRFSKNFRKGEIFRLIIDSFRKTPVNGLEFDLSKVPEKELVETVIQYTRKRYPSLHKILIDERDMHMAGQLLKISQLYPDKKILAVMGAGHIEGVMRYLNKEDARLLR